MHTDGIETYARTATRTQTRILSPHAHADDTRCADTLYKTCSPTGRRKLTNSTIK